MESWRQVSFLLALVPARIKFYIAACGAIVAAFVGVYLLGRRDQQIKDEHEDLVEYGETRASIDEALQDAPNTADDARQWLRQRSE